LSLLPRSQWGYFFCRDNLRSNTSFSLSHKLFEFHSCNGIQQMPRIISLGWLLSWYDPNHRFADFFNRFESLRSDLWIKFLANDHM
jgi:hypothetical protein